MFLSDPLQAYRLAQGFGELQFAFLFSMGNALAKYWNSPDLGNRFNFDYHHLYAYSILFLFVCHCLSAFTYVLLNHVVRHQYKSDYSWSIIIYVIEFINLVVYQCGIFYIQVYTLRVPSDSAMVRDWLDLEIIFYYSTFVYGIVFLFINKVGTQHIKLVDICKDEKKYEKQYEKVSLENEGSYIESYKIIQKIQGLVDTNGKKYHKSNTIDNTNFDYNDLSVEKQEYIKQRLKIKNFFESQLKAYKKDDNNYKHLQTLMADKNQATLMVDKNQATIIGENRNQAAPMNKNQAKQGLVFSGIDSKNPDWMVVEIDFLEKFFYKYRFFMENSQAFFISMMLLVSDLGVTKYNLDKICLINLTLIYGLKTIFISIDLLSTLHLAWPWTYLFFHVFFKVAILANAAFIITALILQDDNIDTDIDYDMAMVNKFWLLIYLGILGSRIVWYFVKTIRKACCIGRRASQKSDKPNEKQRSGCERFFYKIQKKITDFCNPEKPDYYVKYVDYDAGQLKLMDDFYCITFTAYYAYYLNSIQQQKLLQVPNAVSQKSSLNQSYESNINQTQYSQTEGSSRGSELPGGRIDQEDSKPQIQIEEKKRQNDQVDQEQSKSELSKGSQEEEDAETQLLNLFKEEGEDVITFKTNKKNFSNCIFIFVIQVVLIVLVAIQYVNQEDSSIDTDDFTILVTRILCAIFLHMQLEGEIRVAVAMIRFTNKKVDDTPTQIQMYAAGMMKCLSAIGTEIVNIILICLQSDVSSIVQSFVALTVIAQIDDLYAQTQYNNQVRAKIEDLKFDLKDKITKKNSGCRTKTCNGILMFLDFAFVDLIYRCYYYYFMPMTVIVVSYINQLSHVI